MARTAPAQSDIWSQRLFRLVAREATTRPADHDDAYFRRGFGETAKFVRRFGTALDFREKAILDLGYDEITGDLNKMTPSRFMAIMRGGGIRATLFRTAVSEHPLARPLGFLAQLPPTREYGTFNVYSVWERNH